MPLSSIRHFMEQVARIRQQFHDIARCTDKANSLYASVRMIEKGRTSDRAEFRRLFQDAYEKRFDLRLFWALDRFSREGATDTLPHLRKLTSYGVKWKSFTEQYIVRQEVSVRS